MRSNAEAKATATRPGRAQGFRKIKPKGRTTAPCASGEAGLKRVPGRELVLVASSTGPKTDKPARSAKPDLHALPDRDFVDAKPIQPEDQRIELFSTRDEDELAWQQAYDSARMAAARRHAQNSRKMAQRMRHWRHVLNYSVAACLSVMIGAGASYVAYDIRMGQFKAPEWFTVLTPGGAETPPAVVASPQAPTPEPGPTPASVATVEKVEKPASAKTVAMAHLDVQDVQGVALQYIPLDISAEPSGPQEELAVRLSGLPDDAMLTSGRKLPDGSWLLKDGEEDSVKLVLPSFNSGELALAVEAVTMPSGEEATPMKEMTVSVVPAKADMTVVPAAGEVVRQTSFNKGGPVSLDLSQPPVPMRLAEATPQSLPEPVPPEPESAEPPAASIAARGDAALKTGDVAGARSFYLRAHEQGNLMAAAGVARTYDPAIFKQLKVRGLKPDAAKARDWYEKAAQAGDAEAAKRAAALQAAN